MALKLVKTTDEGFSVEYWRIDPCMSVDMVARTAFAKVLLYKDGTARSAGKKPVHLHSTAIEGLSEATRVSLSGTAFDDAMETGDFRAAIYAALKAMDFFSGAEDV